jgi:hypothetical protein
LSSPVTTRFGALRADSRLGRALARVPRGRLGEALAVAAAFAVTAGYLVSKAIGVRSFIWMVDEMLYVKGALGYAGGALTGHVYGVPESVHAPLYSWVLAPIYGVLNSEHAFVAAHALDALLFAGVLVPVYLTARHLGATPLMSLLAGLLSTWVPWAVATLVLMSESLCYFTFAWAVWAMVRALSEPSAGRDALALVLIGATAYTRPQFALLFPAFVLAVVLFELRADDGGSIRDRVRRHWLLAAAVVVGLLVVLIAGRALLGGYSNTAGLPRFPGGLWQNMLSHSSHIIVGAGIVPAIVWLGWVLRVAGAPIDRRLLAFAVVSGLTVALVVYETAFFSQNVVGGRIQERTAFYIVPIFALGLAAFSADPRPRAPRLSMLAAAGAVGLVIGAAQFGPAEAGSTFESIANAGASYNQELQNAVSKVTKAFLGHAWATTDGLAALAILLGAIATVVAQPKFRRAGLPLLAAATLVFCVVETTTVVARDVPGLNTAIPGALGAGPNPPKAWVDGVLHASGDEAGVLEGPLFGSDDFNSLLWLEFWNKKVTRLYIRPPGSPVSGLPFLPFVTDEQTGAIRTPLEQPYLVMSANDPGVGLQTTEVRRGPFGFILVKPVRPYRAAWAVINGTPTAGLPGAIARPKKQLELAVYRPVGVAAGAAVPVTVHFTLARRAEPPAPVELTLHAGNRMTHVRLTAAELVHPVMLRTTIPAGAARTLITFEPSPARGVSDVAIRDVVPIFKP